MQQFIEDVIPLIFSFLGGGFVVGLLNLWNTNRQERKRKRIEFLRLQLQDFYGPLQFFTSCNSQLFKITDLFHEAYTEEYINKKFSEKYNTQERVNKRAKQTIDISNEYIKQVLVYLSIEKPTTLTLENRPLGDN